MCLADLGDRLSNRGSNTSDVVTFHHSNGIHDQGEISGVSLRERQQDELPIALLGFSPEEGLSEWETDPGGVPARGRQVPGWKTLLRPRRGGAVFCLGNPGSCATLGLQPAYTGKERTLSATPGFPRIGGPLSTARGLSTVLQAPLPPRVRAMVRSSLLADHTLAVAGHVFTVGNWSLPMWRFHPRAVEFGSLLLTASLPLQLSRRETTLHGRGATAHRWAVSRRLWPSQKLSAASDKPSAPHRPARAYASYATRPTGASSGSWTKV